MKDEKATHIRIGGSDEHLPLVGASYYRIRYAPKAGALLELQEYESLTPGGVTATKGLGMPRVTITNLNKLKFAGGEDLSSQAREHTGLLVYSVSEDACIPNGIYVWGGEQWLPVGAAKVKSVEEKYKGANSYIVSRNGLVNIPVERAFGVWTDYQGSIDNVDDVNTGKVLNLTDVGNLQGALSASIVWEEDVTGKTTGVIKTALVIVGTGHLATLEVQTGDKFGNALIALNIAVGGTTKVLWQWHIWVPEEDTKTDTKRYGGSGDCYEFMSQNLGAINNEASNVSSNGLYYQWGRSVPIVSQGNLSPAAVAVDVSPKVNLMYGIMDQRFIRNASNTVDWYVRNLPDEWGNRWGQFGEKSPFDPCPEGWRVPAAPNGNKTPWEGVEKPTSDKWFNGWLFDKEGQDVGYYPGVGYRSNGNGNITTTWSIGGDKGLGVYPTAAAEGIKVVGFSFSDINMPPSINRVKSFGYTVRCVKVE